MTVIRPGRVLLAAFAALALIAASAAGAAPAPAPGTAPLIVKSGEWARDCDAESILDGRRANSIRFIVWCSVQSGRFRFDLQRSDGGRENPVLPILAFSARPEASGPGARQAPACRRGAEWLRCQGRKSAQVTVRGRIVVPAGTRCAVKVRIETAYLRFAGLPIGCPGSRKPSGSFRRGYMRSFRSQLGLLDGLSRAQIERLLDTSERNWRRGEPVARVTYQEIGMPLLPYEQRRFEFRDELLENVEAIEAWAYSRPTDTFAGYELVDGLHPVLYVGFTGDQEAQLATMKRALDLFAPAHIEPFPFQPLYTEAQLWDLSEAVWEPADSPLRRLINSTSVVSFANKVEVGTLQVAKVKRLLAQRFGPDAPFMVVRMGPGELL